MSTAVADPLLERLLDGRYQIRRRLATGGMATVYAATDTRLDRPVAVKVMHPALAADPDFVARFRREAKAAAQLSSPAVVNVTDQGQDAGTVFLVMELVKGHTLRDVLRREGALPPAAAVAVVSAILEALAAAHAAGYVHRDVKPENVLIGEDGRIQVGDFGLARAVDASPLTATTGLLLGTVAYLAPEQVRRGVADARTDVYATGVLLFEVLTGRPPYQGDTALSVAYQHLHERVPAPSSLNPDVPEELDELVVQATEPDPEDRPVDAAAMLDDLRHVASSLPPTSVTRLRRMVLPPAGERRADESPYDDGVNYADGDEYDAGDKYDDFDTEDLTSAKASHSTARLRRVTGASNELSHDAGTDAGTEAGSDADEDPETDGASRRRFSPLAWLRRLRPATFAWLALLLVTLLAIGGVWWGAVGRGVEIPQTANLDPTAAETKLRGAGFTVVRGADDYSETAPRGSVAETVPAAGSRADKHGKVSLRLSLGPERYTLLELHGRPYDLAVRTLATQKMKPGIVTHTFDDAVPAGQIISTDPAPGTILKPGSEVALRVSDGPAPVQVPNVVGQLVDDVDRTLTHLSLRVTRKGTFSDTVPLNQVMELQPPSDLHRGQQVTVIFSQGPELIEIPDVVGQGRTNAVNTLQALGFRVKVLNVPGFDSFVARAVPSPGSKARRGSLITLVLA